jgi:hypothetical protein
MRLILLLLHLLLLLLLVVPNQSPAKREVYDVFQLSDLQENSWIRPEKSRARSKRTSK